MLKATTAILCLIVTLQGALAQSDAPDPRAADHEELRTLLKEVAKAINEQNVDKLGAYFAKTFSFTTSDQSVLTNLEEVKNYFDKMFKGENAPLKSMTLLPEAIELTRFVGETVGICRGQAKETFTLASGPVYALTSSWTATLVKEEGAWKISAAHVGVHFFDNPVVTAVEAAGKKGMILAGAGGLLLGFILAFFLFRRKNA